MSIYFGEAAKVLSVDVTLIFPKALKPEISTIDNKVILSPLLFNKRDKIQLSVLLTQFQNVLMIDTRIEGVQEVVVTQPPYYDTPFYTRVVMPGIMWTSLGYWITSAIFMESSHPLSFIDSTEITCTLTTSN